MIGLVGLLCALIVGGDLYHRWQSRNIVVTRAAESTADLAQALAQQSEDDFRAADAVLLELRERWRRDGTTPAALQRLRDVMTMDRATLPSILDLSLLDTSGQTIVATRAIRSDAGSAADRAFVWRHRHSDDDSLVIGMPEIRSFEPTTSLVLTRRLMAPDGGFAGIVLAQISADRRLDLSRRFALGRGATVSILDQDGIILARTPASPGDIGRDISDGTPFRRFQTSGNSLGFEYSSIVGGAGRIGSIVRVPDYPILVLVTLGKADGLASWWQDTKFDMAWLCIVVPIVMGFGARFMRQIRDRARTDSLYRLLAETSGDAILCLGLDGALRYVSPSFRTLTGLDIEEFADMSWFDVVAPEDRAAVATALDDLAAGAPVVSCRFRLERPDGARLWAEMRAKPTAVAAGVPIEIVGNIRDVTDRKRAEDALAAANAELETLCLTDQLTSVSNRRHFDEVLSTEWARATRSGTPLTLAMIDVDSFKAYNDHFGHVRGDECLRVISRILSRTLRRPDDLVARYGGEEFAVLSPGLASEAGLRFAEAIRKAIAARGLPHPGSSAGFVTVSIGVATCMPEAGSGPEAFVKAADEALYRAKAAGRNRVVLAGTALLRSRLKTTALESTSGVLG